MSGIYDLVPVVHDGVNIQRVHPEGLLRWHHLGMAFAKEFKTMPKVVSGVRPYPQQKRLYINRGSTLVANPDSVWSDDPDSGRGSRHMPQRTKQGEAGLALDIRLPPVLDTADHWKWIHDNAGIYGCGFWLRPPYHNGYLENWHMTFQPYGSRKVNDWLQPEVLFNEIVARRIEEYTGLQTISFDKPASGVPYYIGVTPEQTPDPVRVIEIGKKDNRVKTLQSNLKGLRVDGVYGPNTRERVKQVTSSLKRWEKYSKGEGVV